MVCKRIRNKNIFNLLLQLYSKHRQKALLIITQELLNFSHYMNHKIQYIEVLAQAISRLRITGKKILHNLNYYLQIAIRAGLMTLKELLDYLNHHSLNYPVIQTGVSLTSPTALLSCFNRHPTILNSFNYPVT